MKNYLAKTNVNAEADCFKSILFAPFLQEMCDITANMYRLGWDERNGGNISYLLREEDISDYLNLGNVIRRIPIGLDLPELEGKYFVVTGTGKYFRNVENDPETNMGIIRIADNGATAELLWGLKDGGNVTSEFPSHMMSHAARMAVDPKNRVVIHSHPTNLLAMNFVHDLDENKFTHTLWQMCTECIVVFPEGVGVLPWLLCGTKEIGVATAEKMEQFRLVVWAMHGVYAAGKTLDEAFGLIETVEKAAQVFMLIDGRKVLNTISDSQLKALAERFGVSYRKGVLKE